MWLDITSRNSQAGDIHHICITMSSYLKKLNIQCSRLKGREHPLYSSNALIYDAVQVLSKALNDLASMEVIDDGKCERNIFG